MTNQDFTEISLNGELYKFNIYNLSSPFLPMSGVYMVTAINMLPKLCPPYPYHIFGYGLSYNIRKDLDNHFDRDKWIKAGADAVLIYEDQNRARLQQVFSGLQDAYKDYHFQGQDIPCHCS